MSARNKPAAKKARKAERTERKAAFAASHPMRRFVYRDHSKDYSKVEETPENVV